MFAVLYHCTLPQKLVSATGAAGTASRTAAEVLYRRFLNGGVNGDAVAMDDDGGDGGGGGDGIAM